MTSDSAIARCACVGIVSNSPARGAGESRTQAVLREAFPHVDRYSESRGRNRRLAEESRMFARWLHAVRTALRPDPRPAPGQRLAIFTRLHEVETFLDLLELAGASDRRVEVIADDRFAVRWR